MENDAQSTRMLAFALGNPGEEYQNTYHNAGMIALSELIAATHNDAEDDWKTHKKLFSYRSAPDFIFATSLVYMNESGKAVAEALKKFNVVSPHLIVFHDDSDLLVGDWKVSFDRNSGGHKGVQSIIDHIGTKEFWRVRIGIRPATESVRQKAGDFVLAKIKPANKKILEKTSADAVAELLKQFAKA